MVSTLLKEFLKNMFEFLQWGSADVEKTDEKLIVFCLDFVMKFLKNSKSFLNKVDLNKNLLYSMVSNLLVINQEASNLIAHLETEVHKITKNETKCESEKLTTVRNCENPVPTKNDSYTRIVPVSHGFVNKSYKASKQLQENSDQLKTRLDNLMTSSQNEDTSEVGTSVNSGLHRSNVDATFGLSHGKTIPFPLSELLAGEYENYQLYHITVKQFKSLNELQVATDLPKNQTLSVLELKDSVIINGKFTIQKTAWHGLFMSDEDTYECLLCYVRMGSLREYMYHIQSPTHSSKLADSVIWFPEEGFVGEFRQFCAKSKDVNIQCTTCLTTYPPSIMINHLQSPLHKESYRAATTANNTLIGKAEELLAIKEMEKENMVSTFFAEILHHHKFKANGNLVSCNLCNINNMPNGIIYLFTHLWGQKHRKFHGTYLKEKLRNSFDENVRGFIQVCYSSNMTFCAICNVIFDETNSKAIYKHIGSYSHNTFLLLYLRTETIIPFLELSNDNKSLDSDQQCAEKKLKVRTIAINELPENQNKRSRFVDVGTHVAINFDLTIDKYSWEIVSEQELQYWCAPCSNIIRTKKLAAHLATPHHQSNLASWPLVLENGLHLTRKSKTSDRRFCLICNDFVVNSDMKYHIKSMIHTSRFSSKIQHCEEVKAGFNKAYVEHLYPDLCVPGQNGLIDMLEQNQLTILSMKRGNILGYEAFCRPCVECFEAPTFSEIYKHLSKH